MNVLKEYKGYQLIERYDKTYIRFCGGREEDFPFQKRMQNGLSTKRV